MDEVANVFCDNAHSQISENGFRLVIDDLQRMGLIRMDTKVFVSGRGAAQPFYGNLPTQLQHAYFMTDYAMSFVRACRVPATKSP